VTQGEPWRAEPDGRRQRRLRTREAILEALLALLRDGVLRPTAREIATRAGVAIRSIGQHFASREQLLAAAVLQLGTRIERAEPVDAALPLAERIPAFVRARVVFLEGSRALRLAGQAFASESPAIAQALDAFTQARRADVGRVFAAELGARAGGDRALLFDTLDLAVSGRVWDGFRDELGLDVDAAQGRVGHLVRALLGSAAPPP
jgi:AcrR family transcriptional regulator